MILTDHAPHMVARAFIDDLRSVYLNRALATRMPESTCQRASDIRDRGVWGLPPRRIFLGERLTPPMKRVLKEVFCMGYTTCVHLHQWGYDCSGLCVYCQCPDTIYHRAWVCPRFEADREGIDPEILAMALHCGPEDPLFSRLWIAPPVVEGSPSPSTSSCFSWPWRGHSVHIFRGGGNFLRMGVALTAPCLASPVRAGRWRRSTLMGAS